MLDMSPSIDSNNRKHHSKGIPGAGQFAADRKPEAAAGINLTAGHEPAPLAGATNGRVRTEFVDAGETDGERPVLRLNVYVADETGEFALVPGASLRTGIGTDLDPESAQAFLTVCTRVTNDNLTKQVRDAAPGTPEEYSDIRFWADLTSRRDTRDIVKDAAVIQGSLDRSYDPWDIRVGGRVKYTIYGRHHADRVAAAEKAWKPGTSVTVKPA